MRGHTLTAETSNPSTFSSAADLLAVIQPSEGGRTLLDPATGAVVGRAPKHTLTDLETAVSTARAAQPGWAARGHAARSALLVAAADAVEANAEALAELLSREQGKPLNGPNARFEVASCAVWLRATAALPLEPETLVEENGAKAELHFRPLGVVGAIGLWNWPMMISTWQIAPSLRMGNTVVVKPSGYTPLSVLALVEVLNQVLPAGVLQAVTGAREIGEALVAHPGVD